MIYDTFPDTIMTIDGEGLFGFHDDLPTLESSAYLVGSDVLLKSFSDYSLTEFLLLGIFLIAFVLLFLNIWRK